MRINRYLALCGFASRRNCEKLVLEGRVTVNGQKINSLAFDVDAEKDLVAADGKTAEPIRAHIYLMMNKPKGYITSVSDEKGRKTVMDLLGGNLKNRRLFPVGRLDYDTEGLLLLTTDGGFAEKLTHPRHEVEKTYAVKIEGELGEAELNKIRGGVILDGEKTKTCKARIAAFDGGVTSLEIILGQGRNRQIRRMFETIGRKVVFLKRTAVGGLRLGGLSRGEYRALKPDEIKYLQNL